MDLTPGHVAVVTGGASGIGLALAERFARSGMNVVLADVDEARLDAAVSTVRALGVETLGVRTDVSREADVLALADRTLSAFGAVHVVCNNAGVVALTDPWSGPMSAWEWVLGVNLYGVVHGIRAFLPHLVVGGGHIVNTASIAGLLPGFGAPYDVTKHAVVAMSEDLFNTVRSVGLPVGVSVVCPGWVRTSLLDATRNWPTERGSVPETPPIAAAVEGHFRRALDSGSTPAQVADQVAEAIVQDRFWVFPHDDFLDLAVQRWQRIAQRSNPAVVELPGLPPSAQMNAEVLAAMAAAAESGDGTT